MRLDLVTDKGLVRGRNRMDNSQLLERDTGNQNRYIGGTGGECVQCGTFYVKNSGGAARWKCSEIYMGLTLRRRLWLEIWNSLPVVGGPKVWIKVPGRV